MIYYLLSRCLLDPVAWVLYLMIAAFVAGRYGRAVLKERLFAGAAILLFVLLFLPVDQMLARPLENAYPRPPLPARVDGIVVLDGSMNGRVFGDRGVHGESETPLRLLAGADLARRFPAAKLVFSGIAGSTARGRDAEHAAAASAFLAMGVAPGRVVFERTSLDTGQNLANSMKLVRPRPGETWMLVTSAVHMPRAMAIARKLGWRMVPWPSDYISTAAPALRFGFPSEGLLHIDYALHEWIGLALYRLTGRAGG
ncbi:MAG: YdcF family protein [Rhizomicrobium sp.]